MHSTPSPATRSALGALRDQMHLPQPVVSLQDTHGECHCGAASVMAVYATPEDRAAVVTEFVRQFGLVVYYVLWRDANGYGVSVQPEHCHLHDRPREPGRTVGRLS